MYLSRLTPLAVIVCAYRCYVHSFSLAHLHCYSWRPSLPDSEPWARGHSWSAPSPRSIDNSEQSWNSSIQRVVFENAFRWGRNLRIYKQAGKLCNTTNHVNFIRKDPATCSSCPVWKLSPGRQSLYPHFRANSNPCHRRAARPRVEAAIWAATKRTWGKALGSDGLIKRLNRLKVRYSVLTAAAMFQWPGHWGLS